LVTKILAKQSRLGPDERAFLEKLAASYAAFAAPGESPQKKILAIRARLRIAQIRDRLGDTRGAAAEYRETIDALKALRATPEVDPSAIRDLGTASLGYAMTAGRLDAKDVQEALLMGLRIRLEALEADRNNLDRLRENGLAMLLGAEKLADAGFRQQAEDLYQQFIRTYQPVVLTGILGAEAVEGLGRAYDQLAFLEETKTPPRYDHAYQTLDGAVFVFTALEQKVPNEPRYKHLRANARTEQVQLLIRGGKTTEAEQVIAPLVATYRDLVRKYPAMREYREGLAFALIVQVNALVTLGKGFEALRTLEQARAVLARLTAEYPELARYRTDLVKVLRDLEKGYRAAGRVRDANEARVEADGLERIDPAPQ
jgi:tetratricopeptide (TPR) repeat protein